MAYIGVDFQNAIPIHPAKTKVIASTKIKNDRIDARMLAHLLKTDL